MNSEGQGVAERAGRKSSGIGERVRESAAGALLNGRRLFWLLQCAGWLAFGAVMYAWGIAYWTPLEALWNKAILIAVGFALTLGFAWVYKQVAALQVARVLLGL